MFREREVRKVAWNLCRTALSDRESLTAFLRKLASGNFAQAWKWTGKSYHKGLGTEVLAVAVQVKQDAVDQLASEWNLGGPRK